VIILQGCGKLVAVLHVHVSIRAVAADLSVAATERTSQSLPTTMDTFTTLTEVAPARAAAGDRPAAGPVYRHKHFSKGPPELGVSTCLELFE
jgi:hypothetical protein